MNNSKWTVIARFASGHQLATTFGNVFSVQAQISKHIRANDIHGQAQPFDYDGELAEMIVVGPDGDVMRYKQNGAVASSHDKAKMVKWMAMV